MNFKELKNIFERNANPVEANHMAAYMQNKFKFYGVPSPLRKELEKGLISEAKKNKIIDWKLLDACYDDPHRELQYVANDYLSAMQKYLSYDDVEHLLSYARKKQWWDSIDSLDGIIGSIGLNDKRIDDLMLKLSKDKDFWLRRLAIDHQNARKDKTNVVLLEMIIKNNLGSDEFFINKAIGWCLRDYSKVNPKWVKSFIKDNIDKLDKLSIREASKYL